MLDGAIHYNVYLLKLTTAVDNFVFRMRILMFISVSNGHISLITALAMVIHRPTLVDYITSHISISTAQQLIVKNLQGQHRTLFLADTSSANCEYVARREPWITPSK